MKAFIGICVLVAVGPVETRRAAAQETPGPDAAAQPIAATRAPHAHTPSGDDHAAFVGHSAVGYMGISSLPIGGACCDDAGYPQLETVNAPVVGVRHWSRDALGVDAGLGLGIRTRSGQSSAYGFAFHAGLPIALAHGRHAAFELTPEATVGFTTGTVPAPVGLRVGEGDIGGVLIRAGARAGAEVHFGFIGLPELALQATVGLYWRTEAWHLDQNGIALGANSTTITTSVNGAPWSIFTNTITALYYY